MRFLAENFWCRKFLVNRMAKIPKNLYDLAGYREATFADKIGHSSLNSKFPALNFFLKFFVTFDEIAGHDYKP